MRRPKKLNDDERFVRHIRTEIDAEKGIYFTILRFSTAQGEKEIRLQRKEIFHPKSAANLLRDQGAQLPQDFERTLRAIAKDDSRVPAITVIRRGGWYGDVFACPYGIFGDKEHRKKFRLHPDVARASERKGSQEDFAQGMRRFPIKSDTVFLTYIAALAASLAAKAGLQEAFAINLSGNSSTGKTTAQRVALSLSSAASERQLVNINTSPVAALEKLPAYLGSVLPFTDIKGMIEKDKGAINKLQTMVFTAANGVGRESFGNENPAAPAGFCIPITSSERPLAELFNDAGVEFQLGDAVRYLDVSVRPADEGGIFDRSAGLGSRGLIAELNKLLEEQHGTTLPRWISAIAKFDPEHTRISIANAAADFVKQVSASQSHHVRVASHFGLLAATAQVASETGILRRNPRHSLAALRRLYASVLRAIDEPNSKPLAAWQRFYDFLGGPALPLVKMGKKARVACDNGFRRREDGCLIGYAKGTSLFAAVRSDRFLRDEIIPTLIREKVITAGRNGRTVTAKQAGIPGKSRYYRVDLDALGSRAHAAQSILDHNKRRLRTLPLPTRQPSPDR